MGESEAKGNKEWKKVFTQFASINCTTNYGEHQIVELITYTLKKVVSTEIWFWTLVAANSSAMSIEDVNNNITVHKICMLLIQGRFCLQSSPYLAASLAYKSDADSHAIIE